MPTKNIFGEFGSFFFSPHPRLRPRYVKQVFRCVAFCVIGTGQWNWLYSSVQYPLFLFICLFLIYVRNFCFPPSIFVLLESVEGLLWSARVKNKTFWNQKWVPQVNYLLLIVFRVSRLSKLYLKPQKNPTTKNSLTQKSPVQCSTRSKIFVVALLLQFRWRAFFSWLFPELYLLMIKNPVFISFLLKLCVLRTSWTSLARLNRGRFWP